MKFLLILLAFLPACSREKPAAPEPTLDVIMGSNEVGKSTFRVIQINGPHGKSYFLYTESPDGIQVTSF